MTNDPNYPTVEEIKTATSEHVRAECGGVWPDDDWCSIGDAWIANVWLEDGQQRITVYRDRDGETLSDAGIRIQ